MLRHFFRVIRGGSRGKMRHGVIRKVSAQKCSVDKRRHASSARRGCACGDATVQPRTGALSMATHAAARRRYTILMRKTPCWRQPAQRTPVRQHTSASLNTPHHMLQCPNTVMPAIRFFLFFLRPLALRRHPPHACEVPRGRDMYATAARTMKESLLTLFARCLRDMYTRQHAMRERRDAFTR